YRLDVSARIDAGSSWQLGVLAAHALHAAGRLAQENDAADGVVWATGSVRAVDLTVGGVSHIPEKVAGSRPRLREEAEAGRAVLVAVPAPNAAELAAGLRAELAARGIALIELSHVQSLWEALAIKLPAGAGRAGSSTPIGRTQSPVRSRKPYVWGAAVAAVILCAASGAIYLRGQVPIAVPDQPPAAPPSPAQSARALAPQMVPFISDRDQATIRDVYMPA